MTILKSLAAALAGLVLATPALAASVTINGAGATFPYPVYSQWAYAYQKETGTQINYQSIGSGGGIKQIKAGTVDFGASDAPLEVEELKAGGLIQFPLVMGGVVPVLNVEGVKPGDLRLSPELLADIFLGKITKWDDPRIKAENPSLKLPAQGITPVYRSDGSGTTWIFTNYLTKVSPDWAKTVGNDKAVQWPAGVGGKGNEGVAAYVQRIKGAVGYVEYAYALQNKMSHVLLKNRAGSYVAPTAETFQAAAANADWASAPGYYVVLTDQPGKESWPITGASFILLHKEQRKADVAQAMLSFFDWCYRNGNQSALNLHYVPMPEKVVALVEATWAKEIRAGGQPVWKK
ncbi:MAG: phosphate ABC transporter substrate-binding protein PstS [Desulfuromonadales bacterium]|nr:phosphate ABC transporter substrate-binding protein PstS [Desulfuromonadales bacterium]